MSQSDLAAKVGLSQPRLSSLELNPASLRVDQLLALCASLGLELTLSEKPGTQAGAKSQVEW